MELVIVFYLKALLFEDWLGNVGGFYGIVTVLRSGAGNLRFTARYHGYGTFIMITLDTCCNGFVNVDVG